MSSNSEDKILLAALRSHQSGDLEQAETNYRDLLELNPEQPEALQFLGELLLSAGQYAAGAEALEALVQQDGDHADAWLLLGNTYAAAERWSRAKHAYQRSIEESLSPVDPQLALADLHRQLGEYESALALYQGLAGLHDGEPDMAYEAGNCLEKLGRFQEAESTWRKVLETAPQHQPSLRALDQIHSERS